MTRNVLDFETQTRQRQSSLLIFLTCLFVVVVTLAALGYSVVYHEQQKFLASARASCAIRNAATTGLQQRTEQEVGAATLVIDTISKYGATTPLAQAVQQQLIVDVQADKAYLQTLTVVDCSKIG